MLPPKASTESALAIRDARRANVPRLTAEILMQWERELEMCERIQDALAKQATGEVEPDPYRADIAMEGLYLSVAAPCGCVAYFDTFEEGLQRGLIDSCGTPNCCFEWQDAEAAAKAAQGRLE